MFKRQAADSSEIFGARFAYFAPKFSPPPPYGLHTARSSWRRQVAFTAKEREGEEEHMRNQIEVLRYVVPKADNAAETRGAVLNARATELARAAESGYVLASAVVIEGEAYVTFVDTVTYTPPAE